MADAAMLQENLTLKRLVIALEDCNAYLNKVV